MGAQWNGKNGLVSKLVWEGSNNLKEDFGKLLKGGTIQSQIDEEIVFNQLEDSDEAVWSLPLASGYLKAFSVKGYADEAVYELGPTNYEVQRMFSRMVRGWFKGGKSNYNEILLHQTGRAGLDVMMWCWNPLIKGMMA